MKSPQRGSHIPQSTEHERQDSSTPHVSSPHLERAKSVHIPYVAQSGSQKPSQSGSAHPVKPSPSPSRPEWQPSCGIDDNISKVHVSFDFDSLNVWPPNAMNRERVVS